MENREFTITEDLMASKGQRFCNYIIDFAIQYVIAIIVGAVIGGIAFLTDSYTLSSWLQNMSKIEEYLFGVVILIFYYIIVEGVFSRSIGKYITKTIVVHEDGSKPDFQTMMKRTFCRLIPLNHLSFLGHDARGWHDSISDTYVVKKEPFEAQKELFYAFDEIGANQE